MDAQIADEVWEKSLEKIGGTSINAHVQNRPQTTLLSIQIT